ncbi:MULTISPECIES: cation:proton antiporter [unclassified Streptomyces]|uniref:cation:proton antiporter n=1 Tax=unclassified Streptomyces TaxID=2593676 RepID=UPI0037873AA6
MTAPELLLRAAHLLAVLCAAVLVVRAGRLAARTTRQPEVIGEIVAGLLIGPALIRLLGPETFETLLPDAVLDHLKTIAEVGLVLFMVGLAGHLRLGPAGARSKRTWWLIAGSFLPALAAGLLLAGWVLLTDDQAARGSAPLASFLLVVAVSMSITAVPVLARILDDRGLADTDTGRTALLAAIVIDCVAWLLLPVAVGLRSGDISGFLRAAGVLAAGTLVALAVRALLATRFSTRACTRFPRAAALLVALFAVALAFTMKEHGMTAIVGAVLAGLAVPTRSGQAWQRPVASVTKVGHALVPVFFVVSGVTVLTEALGSASVVLIALTVLLGTAGKALGGYAGARLGRYGRFDSLRIGTLMNTRGLTELIVLQIGYSTGILTSTLYLALLVMALATTAMTGPALLAIDRAEHRRLPDTVAAPGLAPARGNVP